MIRIRKEILFQLMHSHSKLAQAEYERNPAYNNSHYSHKAEIAITNELDKNLINQYFDYVDKMDAD